MTNNTDFPDIVEFMDPFFKYFYRQEGRELAQGYVVGLMMDGERKSVEPMSARVNASERSMQRLLTEVKWEEKEVSQEYRKMMLAQSNDPQGILAVDDTGFIKKGKDSVCVSRQYCGSSGKIDNCQIGVSMTYVGQGVAWPYCMDLFVPEKWDDINDPEYVSRRKKTGIPDTVHHKEKWRIALEQIDMARADGALHRAVVADSWYGNIPEFRQGLDDRQEFYVVGVYSNTEVFLEQPVIELIPPQAKKRGRPRVHPHFENVGPPPVKVSDLGSRIAEDAWEHLELRKDSKGNPLISEAVHVRVWPAAGYRKGQIHEQVWLIVERRDHEHKDKELRYFFSNMPQDKPTIEMVRIYHERFWIEHGYQQLKEELGMDHHEGRSWLGWHRHICLVFLAFGYLTWLRLRKKKQKTKEAWRRWISQKTQVSREMLG